MSAHFEEVAAGERFRFGENWRAFLRTLDEERIRQAERSLCEMLEAETLAGLSFLDVGCGSGLFSLAARRLGAEVRSLDYDPASVACAEELRARYFPDDPAWTIAEGSVLDVAFMEAQGRYDIVYSWGVLHHTGDMWRALENAALPVAPGGRLFISIYNDQGPASRVWLRVKRAYCRGGWRRAAVLAVYVPYFAAVAVAAGVVRDGNPLSRFRNYRRERGMSLYHDWIDWLGGLPFEVAAPEALFRFYRDRGFSLENFKTTNRSGTNELVLRRR